MASGRTLVSSSPGVGIVELAGVCTALRARCLDLFEVTGGWVFDTDDAAQQRWFCEASHRHAWHAALWAERSPAIPTVDADRLVGEHREPLDSSPGLDRADRYHRWVELLLARLDELEARIVLELDPSTLRTIRLVRADLVDLQHR